MAADIKQYHFLKGSSETLDREFAEAKAYGKIKPGKTRLFWKAGLRWYSIPYSRLERIYRQQEPVYGKLCCGGRSYLIERLILVLRDDSQLALHIGDDAKKEAEILLQSLKEAHPELAYGKTGEIRNAAIQ